jgi:hypothetical protein
MRLAPESRRIAGGAIIALSIAAGMIGATLNACPFWTYAELSAQMAVKAHNVSGSLRFGHMLPRSSVLSVELHFTTSNIGFHVPLESPSTLL